MDKQGRPVIGMDWDGTLRDSLVQFIEKRFRSNNLAVRSLLYMGFVFVDLFGMGTNASNEIDTSHVDENFKKIIRDYAEEGVRIVCSTRNNHKKQIRARLESDGIMDPEGVPEVIHSKDEETQKGYSIDISVNDSLIREVREGRKNGNYIMWAGYGHNGVFGKLFRKLGYTNVAMNAGELREMCRGRVENIREADMTIPLQTTGQAAKQDLGFQHAGDKASPAIRYK